MDVILLLLLTYNCNLGYNDFIFILSFLFFNNQANIYRNNLYNLYNSYNTNHNSSNNITPQNEYNPSYGVAITNYENINRQQNTPEKTQAEYADLISSQQENSLNNNKDIPNKSVPKTTSKKNSPINNNKTTSRNNGKAIPSYRNDLMNNGKTIPSYKSDTLNSKTIPSYKNDTINSRPTSSSKTTSTYNDSKNTHKTTSNSKTRTYSSAILNKNYKGTCTIISNDGTFTGKIIGSLNNIITLKLENDEIVYINENSIISFY